jgi:hypothetical protein
MVGRIGSRGWRRLGVVALVVAASLAGVVGPAKACSCIAGDLRARLESADGAFIGTYLGRDEPQPDQNGGTQPALVEYRFRLDEAVKGEFGPQVAVMSHSQGSACGLGVQKNEQAGLLVRRGDDGKWHGSLCEEDPPDALRGAARPLPPVDGRGPPAVLVGGRFGAFRTVALDGAGRVVGYGAGDGDTTALAVCPNSEVMAEAAIGRLVLRRLRDLSVIGDVATPGGTAYAAGCYAADGSDVFLQLPSEEGSRIVRVHRTVVSETWRGPDSSTTVAFLEEHARAIVSFTEADRSVVDSVDLRTGKVRRLFEHPNTWPRFTPDSSGRWLLGVSGDSATGAAQVVLVDTASAPPRTRTVDVGNWAAASWAGDERIAVQNAGTLRLFDRSLRERWSQPSTLGSTVALGDTLYGIIDGGLSATSVDRPSPVRTVFQTGGLLGPVAVVPPPPPPPPPVAAPAETTTVPTTAAPTTTTTTTAAPEVLATAPTGAGSDDVGGGLVALATAMWMSTVGTWIVARRRFGPPLGAAARRSAAHGTLR